MDDTTRNNIAEHLERLAAQQSWNSELWQQCHDLVAAGVGQNELLMYVYDDIFHYNGEFHSRNIFGFRVKPDPDQLDTYRQVFRDIAAALRSDISLEQAKKIYDL